MLIFWFGIERQYKFEWLHLFRKLNKELPNIIQDEDKIVVADSLKFITPNGKVVYGGGGIIPDVFVPIDISMENETLNFFINRGLICLAL